jgi:UPF0271 protein
MGMTVDLNCDLGEGAGHDAELMPLVTSANIACGAHAGDEATMRATVALARAHGVAIGAHPGFADREHFGRRELPLPPEAVALLVQTQVERLQAIAGESGGAVTHVKLHGALYNMSARDRRLAGAVLGAIGRMAGKLAMVVPAGSVFEQVARATVGVRVVAEGFADRTYRPDGTLTPRSEPGAVIADEAVAAAQVLRMVRAGVVRTGDGRDVPIQAETICLHGDGAHAVAFARRLRRELAAAGVTVRSFCP